eukprot:3556204-Rhodomonas_salina.3
MSGLLYTPKSNTGTRNFSTIYTNVRHSQRQYRRRRPTTVTATSMACATTGHCIANAFDFAGPVPHPVRLEPVSELYQRLSARYSLSKHDLSPRRGARCEFAREVITWACACPSTAKSKTSTRTPVQIALQRRCFAIDFAEQAETAHSRALCRALRHPGRPPAYPELEPSYHLTPRQYLSYCKAFAAP